MSHAIKGRAGLTAQMPLDYALRLGEIADSLGISRNRLIVRALLAGLDTAVDQIRAEQATEAAQQFPAAIKD